MDDVVTLFFMGTGHELGKQFLNEKTGESHHHLFTLMHQQLTDYRQLKGGPRIVRSMALRQRSSG